MTEIPTSMRASVLQRVGLVTVEDRPVPEPLPDEVLIKVLSVGVCGSDVHYYEHGRIGPFVVEQPLILGHEASGEIVAVGSSVDSSRIGQRVSIEPQRPCRFCDFCREGAYNLCRNMEFYATPPVDGAFCEYVTIQHDFAYEIPDNISDDAGALMEPLSVAIAAVQKGGVKVGDTVLIAGGGPIGVITAQVARAFGAAKVVVSDIVPRRRELALQLGATDVIDPLESATDDLGAHVFIDASGAPRAIIAGIKAVRPGGRAILVGSADEFLLSVADVAMKEVNVTGIFRYTNTWPIARQLVSDGSVDLDSLVTHQYGLEQAEDSLTANNDENSLKRIVRVQIDRIDDPVMPRTYRGTPS